MKANELRIGNLVELQNSGEILKVKGIFEKAKGNFVAETSTVQGISGTPAQEVELKFGGDSERDTLLKALKFIVEELETHRVL